MATFNNPALHEESLSQHARVIPPRARESLLNWLEDSGRFSQHELDLPAPTEATEEIEDIMGAPIYSLDTDDDADEWDLEE
ncbi:MAG: DUF3134 family protein [Synechococcales cyanobacterium C42_A2020_086]|jgi:hypothetical protein|nr:DUF3134 family protein [Synechococcales cyanobacterium M58_A2018_015]MBF2073365.1 DUF3134 family protein [Synechococcales cyanobacterium C42_A2020_086]